MELLPNLKQCLIDTELARLRVIARLWGLEITAIRHLEVAAELAQYLADPLHATDMWEGLPDDERTALKAVLDAGGAMPAASFSRRFGEIRPVGPGRMEIEAPWRNPTSPAEGLWYRGLVFEGFTGPAAETFPVFFIPSELQSALPVPQAAEIPVLNLEPVPEPARILSSGSLILDDLTTVLTYIYNQIVRPKGGNPTFWPDTAYSTLARFLRDPDAARLDFVLHLADRLGWLRIDDQGRLRLAAEPVMAWLQMSDDEGLESLVSAWRQMKSWDELWRLTRLQPDPSSTGRIDVGLASDALMRHLEHLPPDMWGTIADFVAAVKVADPDFLRPGGDYDEWYVRDTVSGTYLTGFENWDRVEGSVLKALLTGPAWWLRLVDLGTAVAGHPPDMFVPRARLPSKAEAGSAPSALASVQPDLIVTIHSGRRFERFQLARIADTEAVGEVYVYRLTPNSLQRARRQRIDVEKALSFLEKLSGTQLPKPISTSLKRWDSVGTEVSLERTVVLRVADEAVMQQILSSPQASRYIGRSLGPTTAIVAEKDWPSLVTSLAELGLLADLVGLHD